MKVKYIKNIDYELNLTIGKIYDAISEDDDGYTIIVDNDYKYWYPKSWFKPLFEIRNEKINKLLNEN